ncbi:cellulase family glycosylhydrolase [Halococcoides cellulosivorans]|uniref:Glycoside hydrolase family 5 domain-containing protein n=1 Tax=Halococcoides cellulosivorans TaxID=1679096 RepID=A0A2R4WYU4_9EURY|nr:cellulase family glycosylhydrolase [Halococcoides cellulosivorans]AWB26710.1 hypothetical protein HARCEL1_02765 [Halococcoides cellulosivorans]
MSKSNTPTDDSKRSADMTASRRNVLKGAGAAAATGVVGSSLLGTASGAPVDSLDHLSTKGNKIVDESGNPVQLNGVNLIDPLRANRQWRGKNIEEMFSLATNADWKHNMVRLPTQPQDIAARINRGPNETQTESMIPHGDNWGPIKPGTFSQSTLQDYLTDFVDPLVNAAREANAYVLIDMHTHIPVFHQKQFAEKVHRGVDYWQGDNEYGDEWCGPSSEYNWDWDEGMCGHRGYLWNGPDQIEDIKSIPHNQNKMNDPDTEDPWFDPWAGADGGEDLVGNEISMFWETVADHYGGDSDDHVVFDIFNEPTGPYFGDWGEPGRTPSGDDGYDSGTADVTDEENGKPYWELFMERSKPWINTVAENAPERFMTIGNPRWSQWTYWASELTYNGVNGTDSMSGMDSGANNIGYTAHSYVQEGLRPLSKYFGTPSWKVPVMYSEFGWEAGGGPDWFTHLGGTTAVWGDGDESAIDEWGRPEGKPDPKELGENEKEMMNHFGMGGEDYPPKEDYVGYREFFENHPVHPFAWCFDHTWAPRFFSDEQVSNGNWELNDRADTPGVWWQEYVNDHGEDAPPGGDNTWEDISGAQWPTGDDGSTGGFGADATDPDGDGLYEDVNGNGKIDFPDVNSLFQNTSETSDAKFDFDGDGDVDMQDVLALFEMV